MKDIALYKIEQYKTFAAKILVAKDNVDRLKKYGFKQAALEYEFDLQCYRHQLQFLKNEAVTDITFEITPEAIKFQFFDEIFILEPSKIKVRQLVTQRAADHFRLPLELIHFKPAIPLRLQNDPNNYADEMGESYP
jgi:hypothetical protein